MSSDGVAIVTEYETLSGIKIYDGIHCNLSSKSFFNGLFISLIKKEKDVQGNVNDGVCPFVFAF